jgi:hypothetical protein
MDFELLDLMVAPEAMPEVGLMLDGTVELTFPLEAAQRFRLRLEPKLAAAITEKVRLLLLMVEP